MWGVGSCWGREGGEGGCGGRNGPPARPAPQEEGGKLAGPQRRSAGSRRPARGAHVLQLSRGATAVMGLCR